MCRNCALRVLWRLSWRPKSHPKGVKTSKSSLGRGAGGGWDDHLEVFQTILSQKLLFLEMCEKPKENLGFSRVREGPGAQAGATWAQKSRSGGVRTANMTSNRAAGEVRAVKVRPVRSDFLSELWEPLQLSRTSDHLRGKVYLSDHSYD